MCQPLFAQLGLGLPELLGQFFALLLDGLDASVGNSSNARKAHSRHNQTHNKTNEKFAHDISLLNAYTIELSLSVPVCFHSATQGQCCAGVE